MYNITAIVPKGEGTGFTLAGIRTIEAINGDEAASILTEEFNNEENGIILFDEDWLENLSESMLKKIDESSVPLVVSIPVITKWEYAYDSSVKIENIIRRAVGYRIKLA